MLVQITGQRHEVAPWKEARRFRSFDRSGLKVRYAFNCVPDRLNAPGHRQLDFHSYRAHHTY
jgi:hypothetical protein